jgi:hypothetical protein
MRKRTYKIKKNRSHKKHKSYKKYVVSGGNDEIIKEINKYYKDYKDIRNTEDQFKISKDFFKNVFNKVQSSEAWAQILWKGYEDVKIENNQVFTIFNNIDENKEYFEKIQNYKNLIYKISHLIDPYIVGHIKKMKERKEKSRFEESRNEKIIKLQNEKKSIVRLFNGMLLIIKHLDPNYYKELIVIISRNHPYLIKENSKMYMIPKEPLQIEHKLSESVTMVATLIYKIQFNLNNLNNI